MSYCTLTKNEGRKKSAEEVASTGQEEASTFSYTVACSLNRNKFNFALTVIEKGYDKTNLGEEYEISYRTIKLAASQIRRYILETPCDESKRILGNKGDFKIYLKKELYQVTDSIKARGVVYSLLQLSDKHKRKGVISISTGNFAHILCHYGHKFRIPVTVVLPKSTIERNINYCEQYSSLDPQISVLIEGQNMLEAHEIALRIARTKGLYYLDSNNHPNMIIGQATLGLEITRQKRNIDTVLLPMTVNGCLLTTGIATAIKGCNPRIHIIEAQSEDLDFLFRDVIKQTDLFNELEISTKKYTACPLRYLPNRVIDRFIWIDSSSVQYALKQLFETECYNDYHGAVALSPLLSRLFNEMKGKRIVIPLFGRMDSISDLVEREQVKLKILLKFLSLKE